MGGNGRLKERVSGDRKTLLDVWVGAPWGLPEPDSPPRPPSQPHFLSLGSTGPRQEEKEPVDRMFLRLLTEMEPPVVQARTLGDETTPFFASQFS